MAMGRPSLTYEIWRSVDLVVVALLEVDGAVPDQQGSKDQRASAEKTGGVRDDETAGRCGLNAEEPEGSLLATQVQRITGDEKGTANEVRSAFGTSELLTVRKQPDSS
jgi:hypothetical protein